MEDEGSETMIKNYPNEEIIVETSITTRISHARYVEYQFGKGWWLRGDEEPIKLFAFLSL
jgi:hypothetical protein